VVDDFVVEQKSQRRLAGRLHAVGESGDDGGAIR
jgi:hypothetical protein